MEFKLSCSSLRAELVEVISCSYDCVEVLCRKIKNKVARLDHEKDTLLKVNSW